MKKKISFKDFVPPILVGPAKKLRSFLNVSPIKNDTPIIKPFVSRALNSYSQFNEDLLIDLLFKSKDKGFYLDIGANDPSFNSNTKRFYDRGWSGVNVEPGIDPYNKLRTDRSRDINLNIGIGSEAGALSFYHVIGDCTLSSFNKEVATKMANRFGLTVSELSVNVLRLEAVYERYIEGRKVDFMTVDVEGLDLEVLQSNDWNNFRPSIVIVEIDSQYDEIVGFMLGCNYLLIYNNYHNGIFLDQLTKERCLESFVSTN